MYIYIYIQASKPLAPSSFHRDRCRCAARCDAETSQWSCWNFFHQVQYASGVACTSDSSGENKVGKTKLVLIVKNKQLRPF